jgi:hypothetical protein
LRPVVKPGVKINVGPDVDGAVNEETDAAFTDVARDALLIAVGVEKAVFDRAISLEPAESAPFGACVFHVPDPVEKISHVNLLECGGNFVKRSVASKNVTYKESVFKGALLRYNICRYET